MEDNLKFNELEFKYLVDYDVIHDFKYYMREFPEFKFIYAESDDIYFTPTPTTKITPQSIRARISDDKCELTYKLFNNGVVDRFEADLPVHTKDRDIITGWIEGLGLQKNFSIHKLVHVYKSTNLVTAFYTVRRENGSLDHYIEIEANKSSKLTKAQGNEIIREWEKKLSFIKGVSSQNRLRTSLFDRYNVVLD